MEDKMKHKHHIVPRHAGGSDNLENLIELTIEEHADAHKTLFETYGRWQDELAWKMLSGQIGKDEYLLERAKAGGRVQGRINAETGHMRKVSFMQNRQSNGRIGGLVTVQSGKGSFGDKNLRLISASRGGKIQGKINSETGHLKRIAKLPNKRNSGKIWITNGVENKMIDVSVIIPDGFIQGKKQKSKNKAFIIKV
jgi:hypothetical protein